MNRCSDRSLSPSADDPLSVYVRHKTIMEIEFLPHVILPERSFAVIIAPVASVAEGLNQCREMGRYETLYICSNYSRLLSLLHRTVNYFYIRRGFTSHQVSAILGESDQSILFLEHDPTLYESDRTMIPVIVDMLSTFAREKGAVIVYSDRTDPFIRAAARAATHVFVTEEPRAMHTRSRRGWEKRYGLLPGQRTLSFPVPARAEEDAGGREPAGTGTAAGTFACGKGLYRLGV
jgi:hypothetical protein